MQVYGIHPLSRTVYDLKTRKYVTTEAPLTNADYNKFVSDLPRIKNQVISQIKPMLANGGFLYGTDLWSWTVKRDSKKIILWTRLTMQDTMNDGKTAFMKYINSTGILQYGNIVKNYS